MSGGHRSLQRLTSVVLALGLAAVVSAQSSRTLVFNARVGAATSLRVSDSVLRIAPATGRGLVVVGTIDVDAAARTRIDGDVILTVEALSNLDDLAGGAADGSVVISFAGADAGLVSGTLSTGPRVAGRWRGSGVRHGRLTFTLHSPGDIAGGDVPLRFVLTTP